MPTVDTLLYDSFYLTDNAGEPISGATSGFTISVTQLGGVATSTTAPTISSQGGGWYRTEFTPSAAGRWRLIVTYDDGTTERIFTETYDVASADITSADAVAAAVIAALPGRQVVTVASPVETDGTITVVRGDATPLTFTNSGWSIAGGATLELVFTYAGTSTTYSGTRVSSTSVTVSLTEEQTLALTPGRLLYRYTLRDETADVSLAVGLVTVRS